MQPQHVFHRSIGLEHPDVLKRATASRLIYALQPSPVTFTQPPPGEPHDEPQRAHISGVNAIAIDRFEGRYLLSGGADSSIAIWDLEAPSSSSSVGASIYTPMIAAGKTAEQHKLGITQVCFYSFDSLAFLSSSYDHTVKIYSSETLVPTMTWNLGSVVYNIDISPIAQHLLVACGTQGPNVRLIDLKTGAATHALPGHSGAVLSTAWSPTREHVLASGATDGSVRFWDIRMARGELGMLDLEDPVGVLGKISHHRHTGRAQAHRGPVNGIVWTEDGRHLVTCGHDQRIRVWDTDTAANTLANFGPMVRNSGLAPIIPCLPPSQYLLLERDLLFYPNQHEILMYEMFEGKLLKRLKRPEQKRFSEQTVGKGQLNMKDRVTALAWRHHDTELYAAHSDGSIVAWKPRTQEDVDLDEEEEEEREAKQGSKKRKRGLLEDIYQDLTKKKITFGGS
ncbi:WD40 repeat-like protein [Amniculicola lignicola CBS 123094]|uniref:WD40 repeat-like protein n=1 Tax=Amniculicola lignicola CBS 123094 TaxID=1392246 RepID=A0A6A5W9I1_9PLEO|nr:WD40 repeat-like protein [Amniculicola lignicola CBS 123094]